MILSHGSDRALWNTAPRSLPERRPREQCAMTASLKRGSKVFEFLEGGAAARKAGRRKLNVFARWAASLRRAFGFALLPMLHTPAVRYLDQLSMKLGSS